MEIKSTPGSVSQWLANPEESSHPTGAQLLWQRFGVRLVRLARSHLRHAKDPAYEAEDLALSTINAFYRDAMVNCFARPANRQELWNLLAVISLNKSRNFRKSLARQKRQSGFAKNADARDQSELLEDTRADSPALVASIADECEFLLSMLDNQDPTGELRTIALMRLDGASKAQIATAMGYTRFTISARVNLIQAIWRHHLNQQSD